MSRNIGKIYAIFWKCTIKYIRADNMFALQRFHAEARVTSRVIPLYSILLYYMSIIYWLLHVSVRLMDRYLSIMLVLI